jgi:membrane protein required for colicin V production
MNPVDLALVLFLLLASLRGATRGFFRESFCLIGLLVAFASAFAGAARGVDLFRSYGALSAPPSVQSGVSFVAIFAAVQLLASFLGYLVERFVAVRGLQFFSRAGGAVVGIAKGALLAAVLALFVFLFQGTSVIGVKVGSSNLVRPLLNAAANAIRVSAVAPES